MTDLSPVVAPTAAPAPTMQPPWMSKTLWLALATAAAPFFPPVEAVITAHPQLVEIVVGLAFSVLRLVTKKPLGMP